jgi:membrane-associated PAP2 superfamily phosphatase
MTLESTPLPGSRHDGRQDAVVAVIALLCLLAWDASAGDLWAVRWFGTAQGFAWRDSWLTSTVLHNGGRWLGFCVLAALLLVGIWRPLPQARGMLRRLRLWWLLATVSCLLLIPLVKSRSLISCPWDLAEFGGVAHTVSHWSLQAWAGAGDGGPGRCFPSGHASTAFSFFAGAFALRAHSPRAAAVWLGGVLVLGAVFGVAQLMRGAHYPSHTLWTAWLCWALTAVLWHLFGKTRAQGGL